MAEFGFPGFNRRYVLLPMLSAIALVSISYFISEHRRNEVMEASIEVRRIQERMRLLAEVVYCAAEAESSQRGYLLTTEPGYLKPYEEAGARLHQLIPELLADYENSADELPHVERIKVFIDRKFGEMQASIDLVKSTGSTDASLQMIKTDVGLHFMQSVRDEVEGIRNRERQRVYSGIAEWERQHEINRYISAAESTFIVVLLLFTGALVTRDIERRNEAARRLDTLVEERTAELRDLSEHLQTATEQEKSRLARELHDELGGLLVAIKMDLAQLARKLDVSAPDIQVRWQRIQAALTAGVALKRRVIEELRPTLLDNMGLVEALRWQAEETCANAAIKLDATFPDEELKLDTNVAIAVFRVAQESLTNMVKHARATQVRLNLEVSPVELVLTIEDNGIGINTTGDRRTDAHGLLSMKYRMQSIGGTFHIGAAATRGTLVVVRLPLEIANAMATLD
jgi:signal transduction histidine kinase